MATISSPGIGSGLDVQGLITQLMAVERQPLTALQTRTKTSQTQLSEYGKLSSALTAVRDAAQTLADTSTWKATTVAAGNPDALTVTSDGTAPPGAYAVKINALAAAQTVSSTASWTTADDAVGSGTLSIELGSWNTARTSFTNKAGSSAITVTIAPGSDSLAQVRDAINAAGAGVTASIINDANGARLSLRSTSTGAANGFRITANDDDGNNSDAAGLSNLVYTGASGSQMGFNLAAANASATVNGIAVEGETNTLANVIDGLTLKLSQVTTADVDVTVSRDTESLKKQINTFATNYNALMTLMRTDTQTATPGANGNAGTNGGVLATDASAKGMMASLRTLLGSSSGADTTYARLADIGLEPQRDGTLTVNDSKLSAAIGNFDALKNFFTRDDTGTAQDGFGQLFKSFANDRLADDGTIGARTAALQASINRDNDEQARMQTRLDLTQKRLTEQYSALDTAMANLNALQSYVSQQITAWNKA